MNKKEIKKYLLDASCEFFYKINEIIVDADDKADEIERLELMWECLCKTIALFLVNFSSKEGHEQGLRVINDCIKGMLKQLYTHTEGVRN